MPNLLLWCHIYTTRNGTQPQQSASLTRPPYTTESERITVILGLINKLQPFLPDLTHKTLFLHKQVSNWDWTPSTDASFHQLKQWIFSTLPKTALACYDCTKPVQILTDASKYGLGAAIIQNNQLIAFASKTLTDLETQCANIECECLSVVFLLEKFLTYIFGDHITVFNDHKSLEIIQKKSIYAAPSYSKNAT